MKDILILMMMNTVKCGDVTPGGYTALCQDFYEDQDHQGLSSLGRSCHLGQHS